MSPAPVPLPTRAFGVAARPSARMRTAGMRGDGAHLRDGDVVRLGERFVAATLERAEWTHAAHLAVAVYVLRCRPDLVAARDLPVLIRRLNLALALAERPGRGYHETITQFYILAVGHFLSRSPAGLGLAELCDRLIRSPFGERDFVLRFYSQERLFSEAAKTAFLEPDLRPLDFGFVPVGPAHPAQEAAVPIGMAG